MNEVWFRDRGWNDRGEERCEERLGSDTRCEGGLAMAKAEVYYQRRGAQKSRASMSDDRVSLRQVWRGVKNLVRCEPGKRCYISL